MSRRDWDYSLNLKGVSFETLGMARLAEYMAKFAELLGESARPVFAGAVRGSVVLRARDRSEIPNLTRSRIRNAAVDDNAAGHRAYQRLSTLMHADGVAGRVLDRAQTVVLEFPRQAANAAKVREIIISDTAEVTGIVVGVEGIDDTAHIRLMDQATGSTISMQVRDMGIARKAAAEFRGAVIRIHARGTWKRDESGKWLPHSLHAESIVALDQDDLKSSMEQLRAISGNGWAAMPAADADALCSALRSEQ